MNSLFTRRLIFAAMVFAAANVVMYVIWVDEGFFAEGRGRLPYAISGILTACVGAASWLVSRKLVK